MQNTEEDGNEKRRQKKNGLEWAERTERLVKVSPSGQVGGVETCRLDTKK